MSGDLVGGGGGRGNGAISKKVDCEAGSFLWSVVVGWKFLVVPLWESVADGLNGKAEAGL